MAARTPHSTGKRQGRRSVSPLAAFWLPFGAPRLLSFFFTGQKVDGVAFVEFAIAFEDDPSAPKVAASGTANAFAAFAELIEVEVFNGVIVDAVPFKVHGFDALVVFDAGDGGCCHGRIELSCLVHARLEHG